MRSASVEVAALDVGLAARSCRRGRRSAAAGDLGDDQVDAASGWRSASPGPRTRPGSCGPRRPTRRSGTSIAAWSVLLPGVAGSARPSGTALGLPDGSPTAVRQATRAGPPACREPSGAAARPVASPTVSAPVLAGAEPFSAAGGAAGRARPPRVHRQPVLDPRGGVRAGRRRAHRRGAAAARARDRRSRTWSTTRWEDWSGAAEAAYDDLAGRCERVVVVGLSMGGTLSCWLGERHSGDRRPGADQPARAVDPRRPGRPRCSRWSRPGRRLVDGIGSDIAQPDAAELSYDQTPPRPLLSLLDAADEVGAGSADIACPVLLLSSRDDHVVPPDNGDVVAAALGDRCERVWLERSFHVATLDYDRDEIEKRATRIRAPGHRIRRMTAGGARPPSSPRRSVPSRSPTWPGWPDSS